MIQDPTQTDGDKYKIIFENDAVRVLEYKDKPGDKTNLHHHPESLMYFLSSFTRQVQANGKIATVQGKQGTAVWLKEQDHIGENIGDTETHVLLVELKDRKTATTQNNESLGPDL